MGKPWGSAGGCRHAPLIALSYKKKMKGRAGYMPSGLMAPFRRSQEITSVLPMAV